MSDITLLATEAGTLVNRINNNIACRRDHPTYGYRKEEAWADYHRLEGILYALSVLRTGAARADFVNTANIHGHITDIDLGVLRERIAASKTGRGKR